MTTVPASITTRPKRQRDAVAALARTEARRSLRGPAFWIGLALALLVGFETMGELDWQSGEYQSIMVGFMPIAAGIFFAGASAGGRDRRGEQEASVTEAVALDSAARTVARMLGLVPLVVIGAVVVLAVAIAVRVEGGMWIGNRPGRTDSAVYGLAEVLQPVLVFAVAGIVGVAVGRMFRRRGPILVVGLVVWFMLTGAYWVWQWVPAVYAVPIQVQPIEIAIDGNATDPTALPADWLLVKPGEVGGEWRRTLVSQPLAIAHDVYLVGLGVLAAGVAIRSRTGRRLVAAGLIVAGLGIGTQVVVTPSGFTAIEVPQ